MVSVAKAKCHENEKPNAYACISCTRSSGSSAGGNSEIFSLVGNSLAGFGSLFPELISCTCGESCLVLSFACLRFQYIKAPSANRATATKATPTPIPAFAPLDRPDDECAGETLPVGAPVLDVDDTVLLGDGRSEACQLSCIRGA